jgi:hypothetical protein
MIDFDVLPPKLPGPILANIEAPVTTAPALASTVHSVWMEYVNVITSSPEPLA